MSGPSPAPTDPRWKVLWEDPLATWLKRTPSSLLVPSVVDWIKDREMFGPEPDDSSVRDDVYMARLADGKVTATYVLIEFEFMMVVNEFRSLTA